MAYHLALASLISLVFAFEMWSRADGLVSVHVDVQPFQLLKRPIAEDWLS